MVVADSCLCSLFFCDQRPSYEMPICCWGSVVCAADRGAKFGYQPAYAQARAEARRWTGARLDRDDAQREAILDRLAQGWSPELVAGRLAQEEGRRVISHEKIGRANV